MKYRVYQVAVDNEPITLGEAITEQNHCVIRLPAGLGDIEPCPRTQWHCPALGVLQGIKVFVPLRRQYTALPIRSWNNGAFTTRWRESLLTFEDS